jgi:anti-sigma28 factor (negative regulator of flagellin synthesis)
MGLGREDDKAARGVGERLLEALDHLSPDDLEARGFDLERVQRIRVQIRAGTFAVDPDAVAEAMLGKLKS